MRKPLPRDQRSSSPLLLLLRGISPNTCQEMIELYVENMMGLDAADYALSAAPGRDFIFICLSQPLSKGVVTVQRFGFKASHIIPKTFISPPEKLIYTFNL